MLPDIEDGTGWSRSTITLFVSMGSIVAGFAAPIFGRFADRHGPRPLAVAALALAGLVLIAMGTAGVLSVMLFGSGYVVARAVSQNALTGIVPRTTAVNWFRRMRGRALGLVNMAGPLGGAVLVPVARVISSEFGWSTVYVVAGALLLVLLPLAWFILKRQPEDVGLEPDGGSSKPAASTAEPSPVKTETSWPLEEAKKTRAFWLLIGTIVMATCATGGVGFHQAAYFEDQGVSAYAAALAVSAYALSGATANLIWGFLVERLSERVLGTVTLFGAAVLCVFLLSVHSTVGAGVFAILFGLAARGESSITVMIQAEYFGRDSFGAISGFSTPFQQVSLGFGPTIAALIYDISASSYTIAFMVFSVFYAGAALCIWFARKPVATWHSRDSITAT